MKQGFKVVQCSLLKLLGCIFLFLERYKFLCRCVFTYNFTWFFFLFYNKLWAASSIWFISNMDSCKSMTNLYRSCSEPAFKVTSKLHLFCDWFEFHVKTLGYETKWLLDLQVENYVAEYRWRHYFCSVWRFVWWQLGDHWIKIDLFDEILQQVLFLNLYLSLRKVCIGTLTSCEAVLN